MEREWTDILGDITIQLMLYQTITCLVVLRALIIVQDAKDKGVALSEIERMLRYCVITLAVYAAFMTVMQIWF